MLTFHDFATGPGGKIARRLGVPCDRAATWGDYTARFQRFARDPKRYAQIRDGVGALTPGETPVALALLHAVDLSPLADELSEGRLWRRLDNTFGDHRLAVVAALLRQDATVDDEDEEADRG